MVVGIEDMDTDWIAMRPVMGPPDAVDRGAALLHACIKRVRQGLLEAFLVNIAMPTDRNWRGCRRERSEEKQ